MLFILIAFAYCLSLKILENIKTKNYLIGDKELVQALVLDAEITKVFTDEKSRYKNVQTNNFYNLLTLIYVFINTERKSEYEF